MPLLSKEQLLKRLKIDATNSSHYVWLLTDLQYYQCKNEWIFAYLQKKSITIIALEPLVPGAPTHYTKDHHAAFKIAWKEFTEFIPIQTAVFISIYDPFLRILHSEGFKSIKVGKEPWVDLNHCIPTGNVGKGVRSARNQALIAGLKVEEWSIQEILKDITKKATLEEIHKEWKSRNLVNLGGFLNEVNPFTVIEGRRYFILKSPVMIEGFLVATPVPGIQSYFLEDLVIRNHSTKGASELVTLEAMVALKESGVKLASLGVVSMTTLTVNKELPLPRLIRFFLITVPHFMSFISNFSGMEVYRKRFKPQHWKNINIALKNEHSTSSETLTWFQVIIAILTAFKPRMQLSLRWIKKTFLTPIQQYPVTLMIATISFALFVIINQFSVIPDWALTNLGFMSQAPASEWIYRSIISDFLYFDATHFFFSGLTFFLVLLWSERTHSRKFLVLYLIFFILLSDLINYWLIIKPFEHLQPSLFKKLITYKDVGGSLILANLAGFQVCQFRVMREQIFSALILACILGFAFSSIDQVKLVINLNHALFVILGYVAGKINFEYKRHLSRLASKGKPPFAKSVLTAKKSNEETKEDMVSRPWS